MKRSQALTNWVMSATDLRQETLLADMLRDTDEKFLYWAIDKIVSWKNVTTPPNVVRIHGTNDRALPFRQADYVIKGGGHLAVANRADEVSAALKEILLAIDSPATQHPLK